MMMVIIIIIIISAAHHSISLRQTAARLIQLSLILQEPSGSEFSHLESFYSLLLNVSYLSKNVHSKTWAKKFPCLVFTLEIVFDLLSSVV